MQSSRSSSSTYLGVTMGLEGRGMELLSKKEDILLQALQ